MWLHKAQNQQDCKLRKAKHSSPFIRTDENRNKQLQLQQPGIPTGLSHSTATIFETIHLAVNQQGCDTYDVLHMLYLLDKLDTAQVEVVSCIGVQYALTVDAARRDSGVTI